MIAHDLASIILRNSIIMIVSFLLIYLITFMGYLNIVSLGHEYFLGLFKSND